MHLDMIIYKNEDIIYIYIYSNLYEYDKMYFLTSK